MTRKYEGSDNSKRIELAFLEALVRRLPGDPDLLRAVADLYTSLGRYEDGLAADRTLAKMVPDDPLVWYNLGCSLALTGNSAGAIDALKTAIEKGYSDYEWMKRDADLAALHGDSRFESLLGWVYACRAETDIVDDDDDDLPF